MENLAKDKSQIVVFCSQFTRMFLITESKQLGKTLNAHINSILRKYLSEKTNKFENAKLSVEYIEAIFLSPKDTQIKFKLSISLQKTFADDGTVNIRSEAEAAICRYLISILSSRTGNKMSKAVARSTFKHLAISSQDFPKPKLNNQGG